VANRSSIDEDSFPDTKLTVIAHMRHGGSESRRPDASRRSRVGEQPLAHPDQPRQANLFSHLVTCWGSRSLDR
jgi:hypothetical protein